MSDICLATGLECIRCNPGACCSRKEIELLSCPFCGGKAEFIETIKKDHGFIRCKHKRCVEQHHTRNIGEAIKEWNTRKPIENIIKKFEEVVDIKFSSLSKPLIAVEDATHIVKEISGTNGRV